MNRWRMFGAALALLWATAAQAQVPGGGITSVGAITPDDCALWVNPYQLKDGSCGSGGSGVTSFNTRTGAVTLSSSDVTTALGYTPLSPANNLSDVANAATALANLGGIGAATTNTLTNKSISGATNTLSAIANASLTNSAITIGGASTALGGSVAASAMDFSTAPAIGATAPSTGAFAGLTVTSAFTATGLVTPADLAAQAANTALVNATGGSASPTAVAIGSCSTGTSALTYNTTTHAFGCNSISGGSGNALFGTTSGNVAGDFVTMSNTTVGVQDSGFSFAVPGSIGSTTPNAGAFTTLSATSPIIGPTGNASNPTFSFAGVTNLGFFRDNTSSVGFAATGTESFTFSANRIGTMNSSGGALANNTTSGTVPAFVPIQSNFGTGIGAANSNSVDVITSTNIDTVRWTNGQAYGESGAPAMGTCGTSPSVTGSDMGFTVTVGSGVVTACTVNFKRTWNSTPQCVESDNSTAVTGDISAISATAVTFSFSATLGGGQIYALCEG